MVERQSIEANQEKRKALVWEIEREIGRGRRPADHLLRARGELLAALCKGLTIMVDSIFNG